MAKSFDLRRAAYLRGFQCNENLPSLYALRNRVRLFKLLMFNYLLVHQMECTFQKFFGSETGMGIS